MFAKNMKHPRYWGSSAWKFLHSVASSYPEYPTNQIKQETKYFFTLLGSVLPCPSCRLNYQKHLIKFPISDDVLYSNKTLSKWLINIHNEVNKITKKPILSYEQVLKENEELFMTTSNIILFVCVIIIILFYVVFKNFMK